MITKFELARMIDHTNLKADAKSGDIKELCAEAVRYGFGAVMVNPAWVAFCAEELKGTDVKVGTVCGFPLGANTIETKVFEAEDSVKNGASEVDYVLNVGRLRDGDIGYIKEEMAALTAACHSNGAAVKVIFENCYLNSEEIKAAAKIAAEVKPDFIKTSTGFGTYGARAEDVRLMAETAGDACRVKAAGGIRSLEDCMAMLDAGAERIGASSGAGFLEQLSN